MNNTQKQFLGFYETNHLFNNLNNLKQFDFEEIDLSNLQIDKLEINQKLPLGKRVELFFEHYLFLSKRYNLIKKNIQIIDNKKTLGEIDFIIFDNKEKCFKHIELVYKYYLYDISFEKELDRYIGPNKDDTLVKKLDKLKHKQLPLLFNEKTKAYLEDIDFNNIKQEICFKANIYVPFYKKSLDIHFKENIRGFYIGYNEFKNDQYFKSCEYFMPHRYDWVDFNPPKSSYISFEEILPHLDFFINHKKSPLLWIKEKNKIFQIFILF
jgi:hypothetical protein